MGAISSSIKNCYSKLAFFPPTPSYGVNSDLIFVTSGNNKIACKYIDNGKKTTILYSHGNACDLGHAVRYMETWGNKVDANILFWDYPGYGQSI